MVGHGLAVDREQPLTHRHARRRRAVGVHSEDHGWQAFGAACGDTVHGMRYGTVWHSTPEAGARGAHVPPPHPTPRGQATLCLR